MRPLAVSRRRLLRLAKAGAIGWLFEFAAPYGSSAGRQTWGADDELIRLSSQLRCSKAVSTACLFALPPSDRPLDVLSATVLGPGRIASPRFLSTPTLIQAVDDKVRADFEEGRLVPVNGWLLALTEVRLYALAGLLLARN